MLTTSSANLAAGVQTLLMNQGIYSRIQQGVDTEDQPSDAYKSRSAIAGSPSFSGTDRVRLGGKAGQARRLLRAFPGKELPSFARSRIRLEFAGLQVYDIQTESGQYLSNNVVVHNCFILSIEDDLVNEGGIMDLITREARLFKYGSGTGTNYSQPARLQASRSRAAGSPRACSRSSR